MFYSEEYRNKPIICWIFKSMGGQFFNAFTQFVSRDGRLDAIGAEEFPDRGAINCRIDDDADVSEFDSFPGKIAVMTILENNSVNDNKMYTPGKEQYFCYAAESKPLARRRSCVAFEPLNRHGLSKELMEILVTSKGSGEISPDSEGSRIAVTREPLTSQVMVLTSDSVLTGPFLAKYSEGEVELRGCDGFYDLHAFTIAAGEISQYEVKDDGGRRIASFVQGSEVKSVFESTSLESLTDWMTDREIREAIAAALRKASELDMKKEQRSRLRDFILSEDSNTPTTMLSGMRRSRVESILDDIDFWSDGPEHVKTIADSISDERLSSLIDDNFEWFAQRVESHRRIEREMSVRKKELDKAFEEQKKQYEEQAASLQESVAVLRKEKDSLENDIEKYQGQAIEEKLEELEHLKADISSLEKERHEKRIKLEAELGVLEGQKNTAEQRLVSIRHDVESLKSEFSASSSELVELWMKDETLKSFVARVAAADASVESTLETNEPSIDDSLDSSSPEEVISELHKRIVEDTGRTYSRNDVINFMICIMQGYITTFAGRPGCGKTSLCNIIGLALGLKSNADSPRFLELSVEQGWASYKDYIGYYNPITRRYEKALPDVYDAMKMLSTETGLSDRMPPYLILLDEANLSPIEHYWAPFLRACDTFREKPTRISLGGEESLNLPEWLRFLATVNFDNTTEELSQRYLDRSWVITLEPKLESLETENTSYPTDANLPLSYSLLKRVFGATETADVGDSLSNTLRDIYKYCREASTPVSLRSKAMINRYLSTATKLMKPTSKSDENAPLDYAVSQKILPMLSGTADQMEDLVCHKLKALCEREGLGLTLAKLERMEKMGRENAFYSFFV